MNIRRAVLAASSIVSLAAAGEAFAADYTPPQPPPIPQAVILTAPAVEEFGEGWYLRGDIGFSSQSVGSLSNMLYSGYDSVENVDKRFDSAGIFGLGIGYNVNHWLRVDFTGEYRAPANFHGLDIGRYRGAYADDNYSASKSELTFLANAYVDLFTWSDLTPFLGAGIGMSRNTISSFRDVSVHTVAGTQSDAYANPASQWSFAWALYAGLGYKLSKNVTVEFAYRYISLGNAKSGDLIGYDGTNQFNNPMEFNNLTSQDFRIGLRMNFDAIQDLYRRPQFYAPSPVYVPPSYPPSPVFTPPATLQSRG